MATSDLAVKKFLKKENPALQTKAVTDEFPEVREHWNKGQIKDQLAVELAPLLSRLSHIERQQERIIDLLKSQLNLDVYEKEIMDLLRKRIEEGK